jgi:hypothetical protein
MNLRLLFSYLMSRSKVKSLFLILFKLKSLLFLICSTSLSYQTWLIVENYLSGKTIVNINLYKNSDETLPGVTICHPNILSMEKFYENYKKYSINWQKYFNLSTGEQSTYYKNKVVSKIDSLDLRDHLFKSSIPYRDYDQDYIKIQIKNSMPHHEVNINFKNNYPSSPLETVNYREHLKCFTFFSWKNSLFKNITFKSSDLSLYIRILVNKEWYPLTKESPILLALHSPNELPGESEFVKLNRKKFYTIQYSKIENNLLTNNKNYPCVNNYDGNRLLNFTDDCIYHCKLKNNVTGYLLDKTTFLIPEWQLPSEFSYAGSHISQTNKINECYEMCPKQCYQENYIFNVKHIVNFQSLID